MAKQTDKTEDIKEILGLDRPKKRWPMRVAVISILLLAALGGMWFLRQSNGAASLIAYQTAKVDRGDLQVIVSATGNLEPVNQVDVGTEVSGTIRSVKADFNDEVKKGQILAVLDTTKLEAQRDQAKASLAVSRAELASARAVAAEAEVNLQRLKKAFQVSGGRLPSRQDMDAAQASYDKAAAQVNVTKANIAKAQASLAGYESDLGKAVIQSPIDGLILDRQVEPGQTVAASLQAPVLFTLAENLTNMRLCVSVDEADVGQVREGQAAVFVVDAYPDRRFPARITQVRYAPKTEDGVVTYECILEVDNSELLLRPGMTATADIVTTEVKDAVLVPNAALRFTPSLPEPEVAAPEQDKGDKASFLSKIMPGPRRRKRPQKKTGNSKTQLKAQAKVWVLKDGQPSPRLLATGPSDGVKTQVVSGELAPGEAVIVSQEMAKK